ncbi:hypothetical protein J4573_52935 [Actinomadura barringtoniae]|uniref:Uncharacterized protein n=1 Tax=Actinomadura barringtoniae TaxID=1427535 RepID=A0A939PNE9_9ACTN|nr:hypothetical protein [Actinomadura barringtoniae]MBO2455865.1 hypothetical protein [Actinomadura barringtoniae]
MTTDTVATPGPLDELFASMRVREPKVVLTLVAPGDAREDGAPELSMTVAVRIPCASPTGPWDLRWSPERRRYEWGSGPFVGVSLGTPDELDAVGTRASASILLQACGEDCQC